MTRSGRIAEMIKKETFGEQTRLWWEQARRVNAHTDINLKQAGLSINAHLLWKQMNILMTCDNPSIYFSIVDFGRTDS